MRVRIFLLFLILIFIKELRAVSNYSIETISVSQGLPNSNVTKLLLDSKGQLWVGTGNGLCMYDGYGFSIYQSTPFDSTTLADDNILDITHDNYGNIWLQTHYGIEMLNLTDGQVRRILYVKNPSDIVGFAYKPGVGIIVAFNNAVKVINANTFQQQTLNIPDNLNKITSLSLHKGRVFVATKEACYQLDDEEKLFRKLLIPIDDISSVLCVLDSANVFYTRNNRRKLYSSKINKSVLELQEPIKSFFKSGDDKLFVVSSNEIYRIGFGKSICTEHIFSSELWDINDIIQDKNGIVWLATNSGITKINLHSARINYSSYEVLNANRIQPDGLVFEASRKGVLLKGKGKSQIFWHLEAMQSTNFGADSCKSLCYIDDDILLIGTSKGLYEKNYAKNTLLEIDAFVNHKINAIRANDNAVWVATNKGLYRGEGVDYELFCPKVVQDFIVSAGHLYTISDEGFGIIDLENCTLTKLLAESSSHDYINFFDILQSLDGNIWLATDDGLFRYNIQAGGEKKDFFQTVFRGKVYSLVEASTLPEVWFATDLGVGNIDYRTNKTMFFGYEDGFKQTTFLPRGGLNGKEGKLVFLEKNGYISFYPDSVYRNTLIPAVEVFSIDVFNKKHKQNSLFTVSDTVEIPPHINYFEVNFTAIDFFAPQRNKYHYSLTLAGKEDNWDVLIGKNTLPVGGLPSGKYYLKVKAENTHGTKSENVEELLIIVQAPIYKTNFAIVIYGSLLVLFVLWLVQFRTRNLRKINKEYKDKERIAKKIEVQKEELTLKNKNITDSINYARRIQLAMMPSVRIFKNLFPDSFILHMPKDIVSGDFYWVNNVNNRMYFSAVDCTGHGVPGAFMSIIGVELFRRITEVENITTPAEVLNSLSRNFERVFGDVDEMKLRDGMDLAFCTLNEDSTQLEYAGAFNPLYIIRDSSIMEIKGDRHSVGIYEEDDTVRSFNNHVIPLQDGDIVYIFTDGFADQFGGPEGKKYKYRRFRHLLLALHQLPMNKQEEFLRKSIEEWKGELDQVDDILVMGLRIQQKKG